MRKSLVSILLSAAMILALFTGCGAGSGPTLPTFDLYGSSLTGTVESVNENEKSCRVVVVEGDDHFNAEKTILVSYSTVTGKDNIAEGDSISFNYNYVENVTEYNGMPHITIDQVKVD